MSKRPSDELVKAQIQLLMENHPSLDQFVSFRKLSGGYANLVYDLNDRYILRVFFRQGWLDNFNEEFAALEKLAATDRIPRVLAHGTLQLEWSCPFLVVSKAQGI